MLTSISHPCSSFKNLPNRSNFSIQKWHLTWPDPGCWLGEPCHWGHDDECHVGDWRIAAKEVHSSQSLVLIFVIYANIHIHTNILIYIYIIIYYIYIHMYLDVHTLYIYIYIHTIYAYIICTCIRLGSRSSQGHSSPGHLGRTPSSWSLSEFPGLGGLQQVIQSWWHSALPLWTDLFEKVKKCWNHKVFRFSYVLY